MIYFHNLFVVLFFTMDCEKWSSIGCWKNNAPPNRKIDMYEQTLEIDGTDKTKVIGNVCYPFLM